MDTIKTGQFAGTNWLSKKTLVASLVGLLIILAVILALVLTGTGNTNTAVNNVCTEKSNLSLLNQSAVAINTPNIPNLNNDADKIANLPNASRDPNCVYVLFKNAELSDNFTKAKQYLSDLKQIYPKTGLYKLFGASSYADLQSQLSTFIADYNHAASNAITFSNPTVKRK